MVQGPIRVSGKRRSEVDLSRLAAALLQHLQEQAATSDPAVLTAASDAQPEASS
jgi:hypothetical protein